MGYLMASILIAVAGYALLVRAIVTDLRQVVRRLDSTLVRGDQ